MAEKIVQTAGRNQLGEFAPMFAHLNDDVLFTDLSSSECKSSRGYKRRDRSDHNTCNHVCRMAQGLGGISTCKRGMERRLRQPKMN